MAELARSLVVAFDLDDTLYRELDYVRSGFRAVARTLEARWGLDAGRVFERLWEILEEQGRGKVFDTLLEELGLSGQASVRGLVRAYRQHAPEIQLPALSRAVLDALADRPLYLVSDGHKGVQERKLQALDIRGRFRRCYLTHRHGVARAKPSPWAFEQIARREGRPPSQVVYVGDDPRKDFVGIRPLGFRSIRVLTGSHAGLRVPAARDAELRVCSLAQVPGLVRAWESSL